MAEYDLTSKLGPFLDRHLVFPLMEFLTSKEIYNETDLLCAKLELLCSTNMVDYAVDIHNQLYPDQKVPPEMPEKRKKVLSELKRLQTETEPIFAIFSDPEVQKQLQTMSRDNSGIMKYLIENHDFKPAMLDTLYTYAKFQYDCGNYSGSADYLYLHIRLVPQGDKNFLDGLWGKFASEILTQNWEHALEDLNRLKEFIENSLATSPLPALQQRTWLIHWSLFVFFNHPKGRELIIEMFLYQPPYLNAIQTMCPHVLRYLATAVVINKNSRRAAMKDLVRVIQQESYTYKDPITEFLANLYVDFDFDAAQEKLQQCAAVLENDFFLVACRSDFIENARLMIFELFCRIHQCISIDMLAKKLNMSPEEAERWIVNLIRQAKLDAKIDSQQGHVVMGTQAVSPYQQLIEKTKTLSFRTSMLAMNVEKKANARYNEGPSWATNTAS